MTVMPRTAAVTRLTLVPNRPRDGSARATAVRRYRVARLKMVDDQVARGGRFEHLKRSHD